MSNISKFADVSPDAKIGENVTIGPFCVVGPQAVVGDNCVLHNGVSIVGNTRVGANNAFYQHSLIGTAPQDLKYQGQDTETIVGDNNVFREFTVVHRGTEVGGGKTIVGSNNLMMCGAHIAHDCIVEDRTIIGNNVLLAGHVKIEYGAMVSAMVGIHHFTIVGRNCYVGAKTPVRKDVPPFSIFEGDPCAVRGINAEGLKRHGFDQKVISELKRAFMKLYRKSDSLEGAAQELLVTDGICEEVKMFCQAVINSCSNRFGRYMESFRADGSMSKVNRVPEEVRKNQS